MKVDFKLKNPHKLEKLYRKLVAATEDTLEKLIRISVAEIAREARARAPYDTSIARSKKKRKHYKQMFKWKAMKTYGWAAPMRRGNRTSSLGHILEFGSVHAGAHPHLMPAFRRVERMMKSRITNSVKKAGLLVRLLHA